MEAGRVPLRRLQAGVLVRRLRLRLGDMQAQLQSRGHTGGLEDSATSTEHLRKRATRLSG